MAVPATQIRRGMVIVFEGEPVRVVEFRHHTPGNLRAMVQAKLKSLRTGSSFDHRFRAADSIEPAFMETHELEYMYDAGGTYHFMNSSNYDQIEMDEEALGDSIILWQSRRNRQTKTAQTSFQCRGDGTGDRAS